MMRASLRTPGRIQGFNPRLVIRSTLGFERAMFPAARVLSRPAWGASSMALNWLDDRAQLLFRCRELERCVQQLLGDRVVNIADPVVRLGVQAAFDAASGKKNGEPVALVRIRLRMLVYEHAAGIVQQITEARLRRKQ